MSFIHKGMPDYLFGGDTDGTRRLKTDNASVYFLEGREFFAFYDFDIDTGQTDVIKVVSSGDSIVELFGASLVSAELNVELVIGGTEGGTFATSIPTNPTNQTSVAPVQTPQVTMDLGGTHTGGTIMDKIILKAGTNPSNTKEVSAQENQPFGFPAGTYYIRLINTDSSAARGVFRARWVEL